VAGRCERGKDGTGSIKLQVVSTVNCDIHIYIYIENKNQQNAHIFNQ